MPTVIKVAVFVTILVHCTHVTAQNVSVTSSLDATGRRFACPGETVTYTCVATGILQAWSVPPVLPTDDPVFFTASGNQLGDSSFRGSIPVLVTGFQVVSSGPTVATITSELRFNNPSSVSNATVSCQNEITDGAISTPYRLAVTSVLTPPPNIGSNEFREAQESGFLSSRFSVNFFWSPPDNIDDIDFASYFVEIFMEQTPVASVSVVETSAFFTLNTSTTYTVNISVVDQCGLRGAPASIVLPLGRARDAELTGVVIGFVFSIVAFVIVIVILSTILVCKLVKK